MFKPVCLFGWYCEGEVEAAPFNDPTRKKAVLQPEEDEEDEEILLPSDKSDCEERSSAAE
jgi:hypothetical protein